jgi:hypothetical protein
MEAFDLLYRGIIGDAMAKYCCVVKAKYFGGKWRDYYLGQSGQLFATRGMATVFDAKSDALTELMYWRQPDYMIVRKVTLVKPTKLK